MLDALSGTRPSHLVFVLILGAAALFVVLSLLFAGVAVALRVANDRKKAHRGHLESQWRPLLLGVLSGQVEPAGLWDLVQPEERLFFLEYLYRFAQRVEGRTLTAIQDLARPFLDEAASRLEEAPPDARARYLMIVGLLGFEHYTEAIEEALDSSSRLVSIVAVRILARAGVPGYTEAVLQRLPRFSDWSSDALASILADLGQNEPAVLRKAVIDSSLPIRTRVIATDSLRLLNDAPAADIAIQILENGTERPLQTSALRLLERIGNEEHLPVVRTLTDASDEVVRIRAYSALSRLGTRADAERLREGLDDPSNWVALHAARGLKHAHYKNVLHDLANSNHPRAPLARQVLDEDEVFVP